MEEHPSPMMYVVCVCVCVCVCEYVWLYVHWYYYTSNPFWRNLSKNVFNLHLRFSSVQSLSRVRLFVTTWTAARQASLSITNSWISPKPMSIESVMPSNHLILCCSLLLLPSIFPSIRVFSKSWPLLIQAWVVMANCPQTGSKSLIIHELNLAFPWNRNSIIWVISISYKRTILQLSRLLIFYLYRNLKNT